MARPRKYKLPPTLTVRTIDRLRGTGEDWATIAARFNVPAWSLRKWYLHKTDLDFRTRRREAWRRYARRQKDELVETKLRPYPIPTFMQLRRKREDDPLTPAESELLEFYETRKTMYDRLMYYRNKLRSIGVDEEQVQAESKELALNIMGRPGPYSVPEWIRKALQAENEPSPCPDLSPGPTPPSRTSRPAPSNSTTLASPKT